MIVLDTNVVSEPTRPVPDSVVVRWMDEQPSSELFLTATTAAELLYGVARLPDGSRKAVLESKVEALLNDDFSGRVLAFDGIAAAHYAQLVSTRERSGRPMSMPDAQIVAICRSYGAVLATRNADDFANVGIETVNPWHGHSQSTDEAE